MIALDADLSWTTFDPLTKMRQTKRQIHLNEFKSGQATEVFPSDSQLVGDMMQSLADGKRIMVAANSKLRIDRLAEAID